MLEDNIRRQFGPWSVLCSNHRLSMTELEITDLLAFAKRWQVDGQMAFSEQCPTYVQNNFGMASIILRFDYIMQNDRVRVYEIEERPALAIGMWANPDVKFGLLNTFADLSEYSGRPVKVLVSTGRKDNTDDWMLQDISKQSLFAELHPTVPCSCNNALYYVRSHRTEDYVWPIADRSITTIRSEGSKSYGQDLGLWSYVSSVAELDFDNRFVLKPLAGSRSEEVVFWSPEKDLRGRSTRSKIEAFFERNPMGGYLQEMIMPESHDFLAENYRLLRRSYVTYSPLRLEWQVIGGLWLATNNIKIHGTPEAITGVIVNSDYTQDGQAKSAPPFLKLIL